MARRDVFKNINEVGSALSPRTTTAGYAAKGASRSMLSSIGELADKAARADQLLDGGVVVELDPALIDPSFVTDRMAEGDEEAFDLLVDAIRTRGQDTPVVVRPHPDHPGRYQTVFGHRRVRAADALNRQVKAVIREFSDKDHVTAQGQENSSREDLSFIERSLFAQQLLDRGYDRATIQAALSVDAPMLTRMLSVTSRVPTPIALAVGRAKGVGRDRWLELAQLIEMPASVARSKEIAASQGFREAKSDDRFEILARELQRTVKPARRERDKPRKSKWLADDKRLVVDLVDSGKAFALSLKSKDASRFGNYLAANLDRIYLEFRKVERDEER